MAQMEKLFGGAGKQLPDLTKVSGLAQQLQNVKNVAASIGLGSTGGPGSTGQLSQLKSLLDTAKQQFPEASKLVSDAAAALPKLQESFAQGQKLLSTAAAAAANPDALLQQLSTSPDLQGILKKAGEQFPAAANLISQANQALPQLQQSFAQAKNVAADLQKGDLTAAAAKLASAPQIQQLLGEAQKLTGSCGARIAGDSGIAAAPG
jgi:hypothetical protein